jgi:hypothetical protein
LAQGNIPSGSAIEQWAEGFWWKDLRDKAAIFEGGAALNKVEEFFGTSFGTRITLKFTNNSVPPEVVEIVPDFLALKGGKYHIVDAKYTTRQNFVLQDALTDNQRIVFRWIKDQNSNLTIEVRAINDRLKNLNIQQGSLISKGDLKIDILKSKQNDNTIVEPIINYH